MASIRERTTRSGDTTWSVLYRHGGRQTSKTFADAKAAQRFADLIDLLGVDKALTALEVHTTDNAPTVDDLFHQWITWKASTDVTPRTLKDYRRDYNNWIHPRLGNRPAETIDELDIQQWVDWMTQRLDPKSVGDRHMLLGQMYKWGSARTRRIVTHNPCLETMLPTKRKKGPKGFSLDEWKAIHSYAERTHPDAADLLLFIVSTGWRFSECTPLTPDAVEDYGDTDTGQPMVFVRVAGVHRRDADDRVVFEAGVAKSQAGVRRINLPPAAAAMIRRRLTGLQRGDLVFTTPRGNRWHSNNFNGRIFPRILEGAGIVKVPGMGPHYLRHTHVAMLDRAGVSLAKMQRRIGHEDIKTTLNVYGGMIDNALSDVELVALDAQLTDTSATLETGGPIIAGEIVAGD